MNGQKYLLTTVMDPSISVVESNLFLIKTSNYIFEEQIMSYKQQDTYKKDSIYLIKAKYK